MKALSSLLTYKRIRAFLLSPLKRKQPLSTIFPPSSRGCPSLASTSTTPAQSINKKHALAAKLLGLLIRGAKSACQATRRLLKAGSTLVLKQRCETQGQRCKCCRLWAVMGQL